MQSGTKLHTKRLAQIAGFLQQHMFLSPWATWGKTLELKFLLMRRNLARSSHDSTDKANMKVWSCSPSSCIILFCAYLSVRLFQESRVLPPSPHTLCVVLFVLCVVFVCMCVCLSESERKRFNNQIKNWSVENVKTFGKTQASSKGIIIPN